VANYRGDNVSVLLGNGDGSFQSAEIYGADERRSSVAIDDLNGDANLDLAVANWGSDNVSVLLGNGDGTFQSAVNYGAGAGSVAIGDLDGDGDRDLVVANYFDSNFSVLLGNGDGTFQSALNYGADGGSLSLAIADLNGDTNLDLAVANEGDVVGVQINTGGGPKFVDVPPGYWAEEHICKIYEEGITKGCSQNPLKYCPKRDVTRDQMAAFLVRAVEGEPTADYCDTGSPFSDVPSTTLFCKYIKRLSELEITKGCGGGKYCPKTTVKRDQMAAF